MKYPDINWKPDTKILLNEGHTQATLDEKQLKRKHPKGETN